MNLEELRDVRRRERRQDSLQSLRESFYRDVADYVSELKAERERAAERADDPFSDPEIRRLTDEIETAEEVVESVYERRVGKVVKQASFAAADMSHDDAGLTAEERDLFDDLVTRVRGNRERVLDTLATGEPAVADDADDATPTEENAAGEPAVADDADDATPTEEDAGGPAVADNADPASGDPPTDGDGPPPDPNDLLAAAMGGDAATDDGGTRPSAGGESPADGGSDGTAAGPADAGDRPSPPRSDGGTAADDGTERTTVRITEDVGEIYGVDDRSYDLASEDVVRLPADNARPLVEKDAAERL